MRFTASLFLALTALSFSAKGATVFVSTKDYGLQYGDPPAEFQDYRNGGARMRSWLEGLEPPKLLEATRALKKEVTKHFELNSPAVIHYAVLGAPRSTSGHDPFFFAWVEWVIPTSIGFDFGDRRNERKAGLARIAIEGEGERKLEIRDWYWEKDLRDQDLNRLIPWDAAVLTRKMLDLRTFRHRENLEKQDGEGEDARY